MSARVGIEKIRVEPTSLALDMRELCAARGHDWADIRDVMMIEERGVCAPWEDPVTLAVNAAEPMLTEEDRRDVELLLVSTESGVDAEKPLAAWVHRHLGLSPRCRTMELKHACYAGTGGVQLAARWAQATGKKALVINADKSRMHFGKPYEFVMGANAAAVLVSTSPRILELEVERYGLHAHEVDDLTRPTSKVETGNSETSLLSYMESLVSALEDYRDRLGEPLDYDRYFARNIYHIPFGGITINAHRTALRVFGDVSKSAAREHWELKTRPSLRYPARMGGCYGSSTFIALLSLIDHDPAIRAGDRVGLFAYGSGSCAEFYSGRLGEDARDAAREADLGGVLDARKRISVREYEECELEHQAWIDEGDYRVSRNGLGGWYAQRYAGRGRLVLVGCKDHFRIYERS